MSARRGLLCLAALVTTIGVAGCAATVVGHGSLAADARTPGGDNTDATDSGGGGGGNPSGDSSSSDDSSPSDSGTGGGGGSSTVGAGAVCSVFTASELTTIFGESVTAKSDGDDRSCEFRTADNGGVDVSIYDYLNLTEEAKQDGKGKQYTIAGKPAFQGDHETMVARTPDPAGAGLIVAYNSFFDDEQKGYQISDKLLAKIVPKFPK